MRISNGIQNRNRRMPNGTYGGVRGRKTKVGRKLLRFPPTRLEAIVSGVSVISEALGHHSETTTQIYLNSIKSSEVDDANAKILAAL